ncbi:MAG: hypothetical protein O2887_06275 [Bacteroidetes bacterium]|nr:hypothetical protein [Bacteroidota bacterium]MDA1120088.1 hypothetical protein [Bacteroidota bacterium]
MNWLKTIIGSKNSDNELKVKFNKQDNTWMVVRNKEIIFMGDEERCKNFIKNYGTFAH